MAFKDILENYVNNFTEIEQETFNSEVQSFEDYKFKIANKTRKNAKEFYNSFSNAYNCIINKHKYEELGDTLFKMSHTDSVKFKEDLKNNKPLFEIFGLSWQNLEIIYKDACDLFAAKDYAKSKDLFYFLVTLTPQIQEFWLGLAQCYWELHEQSASIDIFMHALEIDPTNLEAYFASMHVLEQANHKEKALEICEMGIIFGEEHKDQIWAEGLVRELHQAKKFLA